MRVCQAYVYNYIYTAYFLYTLQIDRILSFYLMSL